MKFIIRHLFLLSFYSLVLLCTAWTQTSTGAITGTVTDPEGAVVSGAQVKAIDSDTGATLTTTTDSSGVFRFNLIPTGAYRIEAVAPGFSPVQQGATVVAGSETGVGTMKLAVGQAATTVRPGPTGALRSRRGCLAGQQLFQHQRRHRIQCEWDPRPQQRSAD